MPLKKDYGTMNRYRLIQREARGYRFRQFRDPILHVLGFPIVNLAIFLTCMIVMSNNLHGMMLGDASSDALVFLGFVGMWYSFVRLWSRRISRHDFCQIVLSGDRNRW